jgi:hypothetical protein
MSVGNDDSHNPFGGPSAAAKRHKADVFDGEALSKDDLFQVGEEDGEMSENEEEHPGTRDADDDG